VSEIALEERRGVKIARLAGEIDHANGSQVGRRLEKALAASKDGLVVDLSAVEFIDSSAISAFFRLARQAQEQGSALQLVVPDGSVVQRVLRVVALDVVVPMAHDIDAAVDELQPR
jgi:anti-sigma B factor antagonist